jgi:hypothetical protein
LATQCPAEILPPAPKFVSPRRAQRSGWCRPGVEIFPPQKKYSAALHLNPSVALQEFFS